MPQNKEQNAKPMEHTKKWVKENDPYGDEFVDINQSFLGGENI